MRRRVDEVHAQSDNDGAIKRGQDVAWAALPKQPMSTSGMEQQIGQLYDGSLSVADSRPVPHQWPLLADSSRCYAADYRQCSIISSERVNQFACELVCSSRCEADHGPFDRTAALLMMTYPQIESWPFGIRRRPRRKGGWKAPHGYGSRLI